MLLCLADNVPAEDLGQKSFRSLQVFLIGRSLRFSAAETNFDFPQSIYFDKQISIRNVIIVRFFPSGYYCNLSFITSVDFHRKLYTETNFSKTRAFMRLSHLLVSCTLLMRQYLHMLVLSHVSVFLHLWELKHICL